MFYEIFMNLIQSHAKDQNLYDNQFYSNLLANLIVLNYCPLGFVFFCRLSEKEKKNNNVCIKFQFIEFK